MGIYAVSVRSSGWDGAPGFNTYYFAGKLEAATASTQANANAAAVLVRDWLVGISTSINTTVSMQVEPDVVARNQLTGEGLATYQVTSAPVAGTSTGDKLPTPTTPVINWRTATFGPRGRGRQFLPPSDESHNTAAGIPASSITNDVNLAATAFITASNASSAVEFVVWSRPVYVGDPPVLTRNGLISVVLTGSMKTAWGVLRSRRD